MTNTATADARGMIELADLLRRLEAAQRDLTAVESRLEAADDAKSPNLAALETAYHVAVGRHSDLVREVARTPARTIEGIMAKARSVAPAFTSLDQMASLTEMIEGAIAKRGDDEDYIAPSLARDVLALALSVDPIFAAIERHKAAEAAYVAAMDPAEEAWCRQRGLECTPAAVAAHDAASKAANAAMEALIETVPTTLAGVRAALAYPPIFDGHNVPETSERFRRTLLRSAALAT